MNAPITPRLEKQGADMASRDLSPSGGVKSSGEGSEHTPGPWTVEHYGDGDSLVIHSDTNTRICFLATPGDSPRAFPKIEANARLIAAAPKLLSALRELHKKTVIGTDAERHSALHAAWEAIAEAEGLVSPPSARPDQSRSYLTREE